MRSRNLETRPRTWFDRGKKQAVGATAICASFFSILMAMRTATQSPMLAVAGALATTTLLIYGSRCFLSKAVPDAGAMAAREAQKPAHNKVRFQIVASANSVMAGTCSVAAAARWLDNPSPNTSAGLDCLRSALTDLQRTCAITRELVMGAESDLLNEGQAALRPEQPTGYILSDKRRREQTRVQATNQPKC
jgi:hypothetical protein